MKKIVTIGAIVLSLGIVVGYKFYSATSEKALSAIELANIEALANPEQSGTIQTCYSSIELEVNHTVRYCGTCTFIVGRAIENTYPDVCLGL